MDMKVDSQIHQLDGKTKQALEQGGELEVVLTIKTDGTIDVYHPESNPVTTETDATYLQTKPVKSTQQITCFQMNSGCIYMNGRWYCW